MNEKDFVMPHVATSPVPAMPALRVLVADDDPASRRFLGDGLRHLGAEVETCDDGPAALELARRKRYDLLLLDCRMPGAGALQVLGTLRGDRQAASRTSPAVASSAESGTLDRHRLLEAGFGEILLKPCDLKALRRVLALGRCDEGQAPLLDDAAALASTGDARTMQALRGLLRDELTSLDRELEPLAADRTAFAERLHRLRSSCGFCGATALGECTITLQQWLREAPADTPVPLEPFREKLQATLHALAPTEP
jgi:CheY-like chemotaxis protein